MKMLSGRGRDDVTIVVGRESFAATSTISLHKLSKWPLVITRLQY